ncbi:amino acid adenylation domain-containing protein [Streptomyces sp. NPDC052042]|uniref:amino acid adenylation domain-containing protein n=1 Tax=Streptomyces sp. NPDC052042 TaxID=3365683 RepID=UPI0037D48551
MNESSGNPAGVPLSRGQHLLWNVGRLPGGGTAYNIHVAYELRGALDADLLCASVQRVYRANPALYTRIVDSGGELLQVAAPDPYWEVERRQTTETELTECLRSEGEREFDLAGGQVFVARLHRLGDAHHVLEFNLPHLLADGWSLGLVWDAVRAHYLGQEVPAPDVCHPADWESDADTGDWAERLGAAELPRLPTRLLGSGTGRPSATSCGGDLPGDTVAAVRRIARESGTTQFSVLLAAYAVALGRFTGQHDIIVSTPYANRRQAGVQRVVGYFVSMLPLSFRVDEKLTFVELVSEVFDESRWAMEHPRLDMDRLLRELDGDGGRAHNPLQHFVVVWQHGIGGSDLGDVRVEHLPQPPARAKFPLSLLITPRGEGLTYHWEHDPELIAPYAVEALDRSFRELLGRLAAEPDTPVGSVVLTTAHRGTDQPGPEPEYTDLQTRWDDTVAAFGQRTALREGERSVTYRELDTRSDAVASALQSAQVGTGAYVGLATAGGIDRATAVLGILKAGAAYVPLSADWPAERLAALCTALRVTLAVTDRDRSPIPGVTAVPVVQPDGSRPERVRRSEESAAYVNFTSGTTGEPKAIVCTDRGVVRLVTDQDFAPLDEDLVMLQAAPADFDAYTLELWAPLLNGGTCVIPEGTGPLTAAGLRDAVAEHGVHTAWLTSALFNTLADLDIECFTGLRHLLVGGDVVSPRHVARVQRRHPGLRIVNGYGPTENTTFTACFPLPAKWPADRPVPIGTPIRGGGVQVWDAYRRPLPPGFVGELVATGAGVAQGYHGDRANNRFTSVLQNGRWVRVYLTGDLGYADADGCLHFLGRRDGQVKVNGRRIELSGLEAALRTHPRVDDAAAFVATSRHGQSLVGVVTCEDDDRGPELLDWLRDRVPSFQLPDRVVTVDRLPLTANGKVDRRALADLLAGPQELRPVRPLTPHERTLADIWSALLGTPVGSPAAHFFQLGGNSLLAMSVQAEVEQRTGAHLPVSAVLGTPVLADLAAVLAEAGRVAPLEESRPEPQDAAGPLPLTREQQRLWFLHRVAPTAAYNVPLLFELPSDIPESRVESALKQVMRRHRVLNSVVEETDDRPVAHARELTDWSPRRVRVTDLEEAAQQEADHLFDLEGEIPLRAAVLEGPSTERHLMLTVHHIAFDGQSLGPFLNEFAALCTGTTLPDLTCDFTDVVRRQDTAEDADEVTAALDHFERRLAGAPLATVLPGEGEGAGAGVVRVRLDGLPRHVAEFARTEGVSAFTVWLSVLGVVLARLSGENDQIIATPVANRQRSEFRSVIGLLTNTVPLRVTVAERDTFGELLSTVSGRLAEDLAHQACPLDELASRLGVTPGNRRPPLSQVLFTMTEYEAHEAGGHAWVPRPVAPGAAKYPLSVAVSAGGGEDELVLEYDRELYSRPQVAAVAAAVERAVEQFLADSGRPVSALELAEPAARPLPEADPGPYAPLTEHIARQAERQPRAVAVHGADLDYATMWRLAEEYGAALTERGVTAGSRVAVLMRRTEALPVVLLGVLLSGAAYVPLDPAYPADRLAFVLEDAAPDLVLTDLPAVPDGLSAHAPVVPVGSLTGDRSRWARAVPGPDDPAYVIYTSGTTGRPKGVVIRHEALHWFRHWAAATYDAEDLRQVFAGTSVCFDLSVFEIFVNWSLGGGLRLAQNALDLMTGGEGVTLVNTVPSVWEEVLEHVTPPASLRVLNLAGEPLRRTLVERTGAAVPGLRLLNLYGPTEDTTYSTAAEIPLTGTGSVPIGSPLPGTAAYVLDSAGRPVPDGFPGELHLAGAKLAAGYLNRPGLTAEKFLTDPFHGGRMYRTGDRVRREPDGTLVHLGRLDDQCKIRGFRVEPGEVERVLDAYPHIAEVCVVPRDPGTPRARLVAFVTGAQPQFEADELTAWTAHRLPAHMVPSACVVLEQLPRTPSGKVDRAALAAHPLSVANEPVAPVGPLESWLVERFAALAGADEAGATTHFAAVGGDTEAAEALAEASLHAHGVALTLRDVLDHSTPRALAALMQRRIDEPGGGPGTLLI